MGGRRIVLALACVLVACVGTSGLTGGSIEDGGALDASSDASSADAIPDTTSGDSGADVDAGPTSCASSGQTIYPVDAFDVTPADDAGASAGLTCNAKLALAQDGAFAGLDRTASSTAVTIDGHGVAGCIAVAFADAFQLSSIVVRVGSTPNACGAACLKNAPDAGCGTGDNANVFRGTDLADLQFVGNVAVAPALADHLLTPPAATATRYVVICREATSSDRDDIAVDSVRATCR